MNKNTTNEMKDFNYYLENLDKVGKEDIDINNDGKVDKSDFYLLNKRRKIKKAIKENVQTMFLAEPVVNILKNKEITVGPLLSRHVFVGNTVYFKIPFATYKGVKFSIGDTIIWEDDKTYKGKIDWMLVTEDGEVQVSIDNLSIGRLPIEEIQKINKVIKENVGDPKNYEKAFGIWYNFNMLTQLMDEGLINYDLTIVEGLTLDDINAELIALGEDENSQTFENMDEFNKFINECKIHINLHINENMESDNKAKLLKLADVMYNAVSAKFKKKPYENAGQKELNEFESKVRMAGLSYKDECEVIKYANDKIESIEL